MKKLLAVFTAAAVLAAAAVVPASAVQMEADQTFGKISEYKQFYDTYHDAVDTVAQGAYQLNREIDIRSYQLPYDQSTVDTFYNILQHTHPELFYLSRGYSCSGTYDYGLGQYVISKVSLSWGKSVYDANHNYVGEEALSDAQVLQMQQEFRNRAQWYLDKVDENMSDFDKALVLHDALVLNGSYLITGETYDMMVYGQSKCYGYAECYSYLLAQAGVDTEIVESNAMNHQWNKVKIDGTYYHVDVTWDDPTPDRPGHVDHTFFLLSDSAIENLDDPHYDYQTDYPSADTRYDNREFHQIDSQMCYVGSGVYAVDTRDERRQLILYDVSADSVTPLQSFPNETWDAGNGYIWRNMYMSLDAYDGYLYMNTADKVLVYDTVTGTLEEFAQNTFDMEFYGLRVIDAKVYAVLTNHPGVTGTLQYVGDCIVRAVPQPVAGDFDGDGTLSVTDITLLQRHLAEFEELTEAQLALADITGDGYINVRDVTAMQRRLAELE